MNLALCPLIPNSTFSPCNSMSLRLCLANKQPMIRKLYLSVTLNYAFRLIISTLNSKSSSFSNEHLYFSCCSALGINMLVLATCKILECSYFLHGTYPSFLHPSAEPNSDDADEIPATSISCQSSTPNSVEILWREPDRPNDLVLYYVVRYRPTAYLLTSEGTSSRKVENTTMNQVPWNMCNTTIKLEVRGIFVSNSHRARAGFAFRCCFMEHRMCFGVYQSHHRRLRLQLLFPKSVLSTVLYNSSLIVFRNTHPKELPDLSTISAQTAWLTKCVSVGQWSAFQQNGTHERNVGGTFLRELPSGSYLFQIQAFSVAGVGPWSPMRIFTIDAYLDTSLGEWSAHQILIVALNCFLAAFLLTVGLIAIGCHLRKW
ncbi:hypothetical protein X801_01832 [Opisthorchis viverrini]|uniref:Fibronectin type-III domain-containing protein n=1 Tax=Opisthorchis viverrini TaxID=6198 RepID=A0A1S8X6H4_OPIVI|nr:hypothetical protein X801_01832 [Opisthorchis viverrini]